MIGEKRSLEPTVEPAKFRKEDPLYPLYHPDSIDKEKIVDTVESIFQTLRSLSFIHNYDNLFEQTILALKRWCHLQTPHSKAYYQSFASILSVIDRFRTEENEKVELQFSDQSALMLTSHQIKILTIFSDTLDLLWNDKWKEKSSKQIRLLHPCLTKEVFSSLVAFLYNRDQTLPKGHSYLELLSAIDFLQISHLKKHFLSMLREQLHDHCLDMPFILTIFDYMLYHSPDEKELINECFDLIHQFICCKESWEMKDHFFQSPQLKKIEPALKHLFMRDKYKAQEQFLLLKLTNEWELLFYNMALVTRTTTLNEEINDNRQDYRWWALRAEYDAKYCPEKASSSIERLRALKPNHLFLRGLIGLSTIMNKSGEPSDLSYQMRETPKMEYWRLRFAKAHFIRKNYAVAIEYNNLIIRDETSSSDHKGHAFKQKSFIYYNTLHYDNCIKAANACIAQNVRRHFIRAYENKIKSLCYKNKYKLALECAEEAILAFPNSAMPILFKFDVLMDLKRFDEIKKVLANLKKPYKTQYHFLRGLLALFQADYRKAEKQMVKLDELQKQQIHDHSDKLRAYQSVLQGKSSEFQSFYAKIEKCNYTFYFKKLNALMTRNFNYIFQQLNPNETNLLSDMELLACAYYGIDAKKKSKEITARIIDIEPNYPLHHKLKALVKVKTKAFVAPVFCRPPNL